LPKTTFRTKIGRGWARGAFKKFGTPYLFLQSLKLPTLNLVHNLGLGLAYQKQRVGPKLPGGPGPGEHLKKVGSQYYFLQRLKLATEQLVHNMSSGLPWQTQVLAPNYVGPELREYHSLPIVMMMQLCILRAIKNCQPPALNV